MQSYNYIATLDISFGVGGEGEPHVWNPEVCNRPISFLSTRAPATGQVHTARWLINSDVGGTLVMAKDKNGDTPAHDAADNGWASNSCRGMH